MRDGSMCICGWLPVQLRLHIRRRQCPRCCRRGLPRLLCPLPPQLCIRASCHPSRRPADHRVRPPLRCPPSSRLASLRPCRASHPAPRPQLTCRVSVAVVCVCGEHQRAVPRAGNCYDLLLRGNSVSGVYLIQPLNATASFSVYCDQTTDGGGWTVFQQRVGEAAFRVGGAGGHDARGRADATDFYRFVVGLFGWLRGACPVRSRSLETACAARGVRTCLVSALWAPRRVFGWVWTTCTC